MKIQIMPLTKRFNHGLVIPNYRTEHSTMGCNNIQRAIIGNMALKVMTSSDNILVYSFGNSTFVYS